MAKRPLDLLFSVDERPPLAVMLGLAAQHVFVISVGWIFVAVVMTSIGATPTDTASVIRMAMLASGIGTILQAQVSGGVGSGYLCPLSCGPAYVNASIVAGTMGGLPLMFGMTAVSGAFEAMLSRLVPRLRPMFPPEVTGLVVSLVGIELVGLGSSRFMGFASSQHLDVPTLVVSVITLAAMIAPTVWGRGRLKLFPVLCGLVAGYAAAFAMHLLPLTAVRAALAEPLVGMPRRAASGWAFSMGALGPFLIASLSSVLKSVGDLTLCQKINDADWKRTDMQSVTGGVLAGSISTIAAGAFGTTGQSTFSSNIGLSMATGATSRALAWPIGVLLIVLSFFPKLAALFAAMPEPVMGAVVVYVACFMIVAGVQVITSRMLDVRKTFVVGLSLFFGLSVEMVPGLFANLPAALRPLFGSTLALGTVLVVLLNLLFRIGITRRKGLDLAAGEDGATRILAFMETQGGAWGARPDVMKRAGAALVEVYETATALSLTSGPIRIAVSFDEFSVDADVEYAGQPMTLSTTLPTEAELLGGGGVASMSGFLVSRYADRVRVASAAGRATVALHFEH